MEILTLIGFEDIGTNGSDPNKSVAPLPGRLGVAIFGGGATKIIKKISKQIFSKL